LTTASSAIAQIEFGLGAAQNWGSQTLTPPQALSDREINHRTPEALALYRVNAKWGLGLSARAGGRNLGAATIGDVTNDVIGAYVNFLEVGPVIEFRPLNWLSFDAGGGRGFTHGPRESRDGSIEFSSIVFHEVSSSNYSFVRVGASVHAGIGYLRIGYDQSLAHDVPSIRPMDTQPTAQLPEMRWRNLSVGLGLRFGTASKYYGRPASVDSMLTKAFQPIERRARNWSISIDPSYAVLLPLREDDVAVVDDLVSVRLAASGAYRLSEKWRVRSSAGWQQFAYGGSEEAQNENLTHATTRVQNLELSVGTELSLSRRFAVGVDVGGVMAIDKRVVAPQPNDSAEPLPRFSAAAPTSGAMLLAMPYLRYYVGERLGFDLRGSATLTNPYNKDLDNRLPEPQSRSGLFGGGGLGITYALLRQ